MQNLQFLFPETWNQQDSVWEPDVLKEGRGRGTDESRGGQGSASGVICQDKLCDPRLGTTSDNPECWNREKTPADKLLFSDCGVFLCTDNQLGVSLIQLSVSSPAEIN